MIISSCQAWLPDSSKSASDIVGAVHLQNNKLSICRDILINHEFIQLGRVLEENGMLIKNPNLYYIVGINGSKQQKIIDAHEMRAMYTSMTNK